MVAGVALGWAIASAQERAGDPKEVRPPEVPVPEKAGPDRPLDTLDWLVGDWVAEDEGISVEFSCHFTKNNAFIVRAFKVVTTKDIRMSGMQLIAWDAAQENIRSWTFDSDGGFGEDTWTQSGNTYTVRAKYTLPDGGKASAVNVMTFINNDRCTWKSVNREIDGEIQPDVEEISLVRKPEVGPVEPKGGK
jgi:hypothetical protein